MALNMKRVTDLQEKTEVLDDDLFAAGNNGTPSLRKTKWSTIWNKILNKIRSDVIVNNKTTTEAGYALDARMGKDIQRQIDELNTNTKKLIWIRDYQTEHFSIPAGTAKSHETAAPAVEGYHPAGIVGIYHGNNNGDIVISKFYCKSDAGEIGVVVKNNGNVAANTALYFQIMYVKNL